MDNTVVEAISRELGKKGLAWLKFNFRGVGRSEGIYADGVGEREDARAAVSFGSAQEKVDRERMGICGYSFGSSVALGAAVEDARVKAVAGISPFVQPPDLLNDYQRPKLLISGTQDEWVDPRDLETLVQNLPEPKELVIQAGADHFWFGSESLVAEKVGIFFARYLTQS